jgi:MFS family permease
MVDLANIVIEERLMSPMRNYAVVTASYWGFTLTDGALRMLVLLHFYSLGYTPFMLAFLFLLYETAGIFANLGGGWLATRFGIPRMLMTGLTLQITSLLLLSALNPTWSAALSVAWVVAMQGIAGVAKDITKTASKSAIKATSEGGSGQLFRWVAWFTGSKNAMKGMGFFFGGLLLETLGFQGALWLMAGVLVCILAGVTLSLPRTLGKAKASESFRELFAKSPAINLMAAARFFLFGSRDVWFVVGLPVFLYSQGWRYLEVSGFIASWTIGLRPGAGHRALGHPAQRGRLVTRGAGGAAMGCSANCAAAYSRPWARPRLYGASRSRNHGGSWRVRFRVRRDFVAAFLSDPGLCGF